MVFHNRHEPPSKGVLAVNTSVARVKRPVSYKLIWSCHPEGVDRSNHDLISTVAYNDNSVQCNNYSIWFPVAPQGYVALGCVVFPGCTEPPLSYALCILASLVSPCPMKDCITLSLTERYASCVVLFFPLVLCCFKFYKFSIFSFLHQLCSSSSNIAFWRVENSFGSFLPANPVMSSTARPYDLRHMSFGYSERSTKASKRAVVQDNFQQFDRSLQLERSSLLNSGRMFEAIASFRLIWWNQGTTCRKKLSIWRPVLQPGMVYLGDLAVNGYVILL